MQPKKSAIFASLGVKTISLALASSCLIYSAADAAGLGKLTVLSALGQPLRAEIELTSVNNDDAGNLVPKLASAEAFRQANIEFSSNLQSLRFSVEERGTRHFVLVTSTQSVNEPYVELLLELNSSNGKLMREYTMLIDPIEMQTNNAASSSAIPAPKAVVAAPAPTVSVAPVIAPTVTPAPTVAQEKASEKIVERPVTPAPTKIEPAAKNTGAADYQIKTGDTLGKIADQLKPAGVSLDQMLVALHKSNPNAFINNNMNLLRAGKILSIPGASEIEQTTNSEARKIVMAQSVDFNAYRNKLANQVSDAAPTPESKKTDSGKITSKVTETPTSANEAKDKLKLSKALQQEQADKKALEEDKIAKQKALDAANARVKELEQNTAKLQNILDLKNKAAPVVTKAEPVAAAVPASVTAVEASVPAPVPKVVKPKVVVAPAPISAPAPSLMDNLMHYLPYAAGLLALLGLAGVYSSKRKKKPEHFDDESILTGSSMKANSLFGSTGGQSVDTNNSVFNSNFAPSASQLDANEVDPVAEADVYIAYGRDEQAEEILKEALRTQPERQAVRLKLLEIYAHRKDTHTFETIASELYGMTGGAGTDWAQAASLGLMIDPQNPLYAGGQTGDHAAVLGSSTLPIESLDPEALLGNSLSQQMLDSIAAKHDTSPSMMLGDVNDSTHRTADVNDGLDFDLGLASPAEPEQKAFTSNFNSAEENDAALASSIDANDLQFETSSSGLDFTPQVKPAAPVLPEAEPEPAEAGDGGMDFAALDFDFEIPSTKAAETKPVVTPAAKPAEEAMPALEMPAMAAPEPAAFDFDLSGIDLELPQVAADASEPNFGSSQSDAAQIEAFNSANAATETVSEEEFSAEMATKLDLAIAYQEIGDKDGARELLDEVLKAGSKEQIARAKTMLQDLS